MWYKRLLKTKIESAAKNFPAVLLTGARQTGKTSLLKKMFPSHTYVTLDTPAVAMLAKEDPSGFIHRFKPPLLIDEVQYAPELFRHLKVEIDKNRHNMGNFILTGSQQFNLMKHVGDSLAGRIAIFALQPFCTKEISQHQTVANNIESYITLMIRGGFPELWRNTLIAHELFFSSYLSTYLERDVRQILNISSLRNFERFLRICATMSGQLFNKTAVANAVGISIPTVTAWLSILEASNQIVLLEPWYSNMGKRIVKSPKLYFSDTGMLCYLLGISPENIIQSPFIGAIWENFIFNEIKKQLTAKSSPETIWFYRDKNQLEVDFIIAGGGKGTVLECKWNEYPDKKDAKGIKKLISLIKKSSPAELQTVKGQIISRTPVTFKLDTDIEVTNIFEF